MAAGNQVEQFERRTFLAATLVSDINSASASSGSPNNLAVIGGQLFFAGTDATHGSELWISDGTAAGTRILKDLNGTSAGSAPSNFVDVNGTAFFCANTTGNSTQLWRSDGTAAGTIMLRTFVPLIGNPVTGVGFAVDVNGTLLFAANDGVHGLELWKSDGTVEGTVLVKDHISSGGINGVGSTSAASLDGVLYYAGADSINGYELWRSDGTTAGTYMFAELTPGQNLQAPNCANFARCGELVYFSANPSFNDSEPWVTDGTLVGTRRVADLHSSGSSFPAGFTNVNGTAFFRATTAPLGTELFKTNGFESGTGVVKDIFAGNSSSSPSNFTVVGDRLFFTANNGFVGTELWVSDGTDSGTSLVKDLAVGTSSSSFAGFANLNGTLFFIANSKLHKTDGTSAGTLLVGDTAAGNLTAYNNKVFFSANDATHGTELWASEGSPANTFLFREIYASTSGSSLANFIDFNGTLLFAANDGISGTELWKSTGAEGQTSLVKDIRSGSSSGITPAANSRFIGIDDTLYFAANDGITGTELWKSDGTTAGTMLVKDINTTGAGNSLPNTFVDVDGTLFFFANDGPHGNELWKSDGTTDGTVLVKDIWPGVSNSGAIATALAPRALNGILYFQAQSDLGAELWRSDGTEAGTYIVKDINPGAAGSGPVNFTDINGTLYFRASDGVHDRELWRSDGTEAGTIMVKDVDFVGAMNSPMVTLNGRVIFALSTAGQIQALWSSDGTEQGTYRLNETASNVSNLTVVGTKVLFQASDGVHGAELWVTDGTAAGTYLVKDLTAGAASSSPASFVNVNGTLFFSANNGSGTNELWKSDGTAGGTMPVMDNTAPTLLTNVNGTLFFAATDPAETIGQELYKYINDVPAVVQHIAGNSASDVIRIARDQANPTQLDVFINNATATPTASYYFPTLAQLIIDAGGGNNQLTIDSSLDNAIPSGGLIFNASAGNDTADYTAAPAGDGPLTYAGGTGADALNVLAGTFTANTDNGAATTSLTVNVASDAQAIFNASQHLNDLNITGRATLTSDASRVLHLGTLSFNAAGQLDLTDNDMIITNMSHASVEALVASGFGNYDWQGTGITSSTAAAFAASDGSRALGVIDNADWNYENFSGQSVSETDVLVKFTWTGDSNLDGVVDNDDFGQFLYGFNGAGSATWLNGDFDLNGFVDNDDFGWFLTGKSAFDASGGLLL